MNYDYLVIYFWQFHCIILGISKKYVLFNNLQHTYLINNNIPIVFFRNNLLSSRYNASNISVYYLHRHYFTFVCLYFWICSLRYYEIFKIFFQGILPPVIYFTRILIYFTRTSFRISLVSFVHAVGMYYNDQRIGFITRLSTYITICVSTVWLQ